MVQCGQHLGLSLEAGQASSILGKGLRQDLDRRLTIELGIGGPLDLAHAPLAELSGDLIVCDVLVDNS